MQRVPGAGGRRKRTTGVGGGNAYRRGDGLGSGPIGNAGGYGNSSSGRSGGQRSAGGSLLPLLLGLGAAAVSGGGNNNKKRGGFSFKKLLFIILLIIVGYWLLKSCAANNVGGEAYGNNGDLYSAYGNDAGQYEEEEPAPAPVQTPAPQLSPANDTSADYAVSNRAREKYTKVLGSGNDVWTIMVYMCGTDLESNYGMATADLNEMLHADLGENVNLIVETGGCKKWKNSVVSSATNQRYQVAPGKQGLAVLDKKVGKRNMTDADTLSDFITYCAENFPANRNALILWDHGGGSLSGYGYDQNFSSASMTLDKFDKALKDANCKFDFIGFDACLMANYETAVVAEKYADYLIASEETEPGTGWYYTNWLGELSDNTSMKTVQIGKNIIDDFTTASAKAAAGSATTLSIVDLAEFAGSVPEAFNAFAKDAVKLLDSEDYQTVSNARSDTREFAASTNINQVDLVDLCTKLGTDPAQELAQALQGCIKYNRYSRGMSNSYGLSIYFPYGRLSSLNQALSLYDDIGMDQSYTECIRSFASLAAGGQVASGTSGSPLTTLLGGDSGYTDLLGSLLGGSTGYSGGSTGSGSGYGSYTDVSSSDILTSVLQSYLSGATGGSTSSAGSYSNSSSSYGGGYADILSAMLGGGNATSWLDTGRMMKSADYYDENRLDASRLVPTTKGASQVLSLTDAEWDMVQNIQLNVFLDDGKGYIDLGMDNTYTFDDDLDLVMDYDRTWMTINGQNVAYYFMDETQNDDGSTTITGRVPALLNGELVDIILRFDDADPYGTVVGARIVYGDVTSTQAKGLVEIVAGDKIDFLCDYYKYDGSYVDSYKLGARMTATGAWTISNETVGSGPCKVTYCLTDMYNNRYWTQSIEG